MNTDIELIELAKKDNSLLEELMHMYEPLMYVVIRPYKIPGYTQEDLMQEARASFCQAVKAYDKERSQLSTFAFTSINNRMKTLKKTANAIKRNGVVFSLDSDEYKKLFSNIPSSTPNPEDKVILDEIIQEIKSKLSPYEFEVAMLAARGFSYASIAEQMNKTVKNIDNTLQRVKRKLRG